MVTIKEKYLVCPKQAILKLEQMLLKSLKHGAHHIHQHKIAIAHKNNLNVNNCAIQRELCTKTQS